MTKKQQKISVYSYDCKAFVDEIKLLANTLENQNLSNANVRALNCKICQVINNEITACMKLSKVKGYDDYKVINRGATSLCYLSINDAQQKTILKVFEPERFPLTTITPYSDITHGAVVSYNWIDCNRTDSTQELAFLKRFVRFILQEELITTLQINANKEKRNLFIVPELTLTTKGFAFISPCFFGDTLKERFQKYAETTTSTTEEKICDSVMVVRQAAEYIRDVCHGKNIYHGDIKPSNFFDIKDGDSHLIKNIDFDTLVDFNENSFCRYRNWDVAATTPLFYYADTARITRNQDFDKIKEYDIIALSRMLMYAIICIYGEEENLYNAFNSDSNHFNWIDFFFEDSDVGERLFNDICITDNTRGCDCSERIKLSGLFIFEKIRSLLMRCSEKVKYTSMIVDIQEFIECSLLIEELFKHNKNDFSMPSDTGKQGYILNGAIRHLNLLYLDNENIRNNKRIVADYHKLIDLRPSINWVQDVIEQNYYKQNKNDYDKIDRHLIPDIDFGDGSELFEYEFDKKGDPISSSSLEQALKTVGDKSLFLTAEGGQGKTTTLRSFWLDFLSRKQDALCLYVDLKRLSINAGSKAIKQYIYDCYHIDRDNLQNHKPLLLLDGANECNVDLRDVTDANDDCKLVTECKDLIKSGIRIVLSSRLGIIRVKESDSQKNIEQYQSKESDSQKNIEQYSKDFSIDEIQYTNVCSLRDEQIEYCLKEELFKNIHDRAPMIDLLRNNMMLHIYTRLKDYDIEFEPKEMKAGILLDKYFQICFRTRYVRSCIGDLGRKYPTDKKLYDEIKKIEDKNKTNMPDDNEANIRLKSKRFDLISKKLTEKSGEMTIEAEELCDIDLGTFENLSILTKDANGMYAWSNEVYQEYFQALHIKGVISKLYEDDDYLKRFIEYDEEKKIWNDHYSNWQMRVICDNPRTEANIRKYNAIHYAGEMLGYNKFEFAAIKHRISSQMHQNPRVPNYLYIDETELITIMCLLSCNELPNGIAFIGSITFYDCPNITSIEIPNSVKYISNQAFMNCKNLNSVKMWNGIAEIGESAFEGCSNLVDINMPYSVKKIEKAAFQRCGSLVEILIPESVVSIGDCAFAECSELNKVFLSKSVKEIGGGAFAKCNKIEKINVKEGNSRYYGDGNCLIEKDTKTLVAGCNKSIIPNDGSIRTIGPEAFSGCEELTHIIIPDGVEEISHEAFWGCSNLTGIDLSNSLTNIQYEAFENCESLDEVILPKNLKKIGARVFKGCSNLKSLIVPREVSTIHYGIISNCNNLERIEVEEGNSKYVSYGNCLIEEDTKTLVAGCNKSIIPNDGSIRIIGPEAFSGCEELTHIIIPKGVEEIGHEAFFGCIGLIEIIIPNTVRRIGFNIFSHCKPKRIKLPRDIYDQIHSRDFCQLKNTEIIFID